MSSCTTRSTSASSRRLTSRTWRSSSADDRPAPALCRRAEGVGPAPVGRRAADASHPWRHRAHRRARTHARGYAPAAVRRADRCTAARVPGKARDRLRVRARRAPAVSRQRVRAEPRRRCSVSYDPDEAPELCGSQPAADPALVLGAREGPRAGDRPDRQRQVDDARRDDRPHQRDDVGSHPDARGADRVRAQAEALPRQPARGRRADALVQQRAQERAARGSRCDPRRRASRPRDGEPRAARRRDRPPRVCHRAHDERAADDRSSRRRVTNKPAGADPHDALRVAGRRGDAGAAAQGRRRTRRGDRDPRRDACRAKPDPREQDVPDRIRDADRRADRHGHDGSRARRPGDARIGLHRNRARTSRRTGRSAARTCARRWPMSMPDSEWDPLLRGLLDHMLSVDASDLYLAAGSPPVFRINGVGFRANIFRQRGATGMVVRLVRTQIKTLEELHHPPILSELMKSKRGLILVVGGTGSGKSTTLAAMIDHRNRTDTGHIITVEDPVEFIHSHQKCVITQREVGVDTRSYHDALKNALRQAPDLILIGEIRDAETMENAITFAETGHLCLATLHSNNANQTIERILNFFPPERAHEIRLQLSLNLRAIISQRLVKTQDGGRAAALEILLDTPRIRELIKRGEIEAIKDAMEQGTGEGCKTFDGALYDLVVEGRITDANALEAADSPNNLRIRLDRFRSTGRAVELPNLRLAKRT